MKYSIARYTGIGENPLVILLDRKRGDFKNQFSNINDLKKHLGDDTVIYFVADKNNNRLDGLDNWNGGVFNFNNLENLIA